MLDGALPMIEDLVTRLRKRAEIRRKIPRGEPDRISDILEEAATELEHAKKVNRGWFDVTPDFMAKMLHLPEDTEITGIRWNEGRRMIEVFAKHPDFPDNIEGIVPMRSCVVITAHSRVAEPGDMIVTYTSKWHT